MGSFRIENGRLIIESGALSLSIDKLQTACSVISDGNGLSEPYTDVIARGKCGERHFHMWEGLSLIYMPDYVEGVVLTLTGEHWVVRSVKLHAFSDENDTLTEEGEYNLFGGKLFLPVEGEMFFLEDPQSGNAYVIISEDPDYTRANLEIKNYELTVRNGGVPIAIGACRVGECEALARAYYRHAKKPTGLVSMSNTWGDRNGISRVCRDFVLREVDTAKELGVDIVQIDDGWQTGQTSDPGIYDSTGKRHFEGDFWQINTERFPNGIKEITDYAAERGVKVGMWFAPDSNGCFSLLKRDKEVLRKAYEEWGARFFKLDMYWVLGSEYREKFLELLRKIYTFGDDVAVQLDVTRNNRVNYLCGRQYGTVFVENRYHRSGNSFPHRVLRNLWSLGRYLPTQKFQFELINPDLYKECYREGDPFVPSLYDMDYLFAAVMFSNPLFWMEMQFLSEERKAELGRIMSVWRSHRGALAGADIQPIGEKPCGRAFTGFCATVDAHTKYLLIFREVTHREEAVICAPVSEGDISVLAANTDVSACVSEGAVRIKLGKERGYAFIKLDI